ncbi:MAG: hypothetical protein R3B09_08415 [Nannocystaceae bacterium]
MRSYARIPTSPAGTARLGLSVIATFFLASACGAAGPTHDPSQEVSVPEAKPDGPIAAPDKPAPLPTGPRVTKASQRERKGPVWIFDGDPQKPRKSTADEAEAEGFTVIDLGDGWVPYIFSEKTVGAEDFSANDYRQKYVGLATNVIDSDGEKLKAHERNYLELYGIPPTLTVIRDEWEQADGEIQPCLDAAGFDPKIFERFSGGIAYKPGPAGKKDVRKAAWLKQDLEKKLKKAKLDPSDLAAAEADPRFAQAYKNWRALQDDIDVVDHAQRRLRCERMFASGKKGEGKFERGVLDKATSHALASFEKKHAIMGWGHFTKENVEVLGLTQDESIHARLLRVVDERTVTAAGILEDGSAARWKKDFKWKDAKGQELPLRDLVAEAHEAVVKALDLGTAEGARSQLAILSDLNGESGGGFAELLVAVRLPPLPDYYSDDMDLQVVIDRGDVWYDFPFDDKGNRLAQPRDRRPRFTLYTNYEGQKIPLVRWPTTIGSWRMEMYNGTEHYKYKNSDVGERVWKEIVAGPTWIPPASTPPRELLKRRWKDGRVQTLVNYDEMGPGYASAYGLVAAYHIREVRDDEGNVTAEVDNQIRTHGSVDYMSIMRRFSHGCHRLYNMSAVRLFSFVLMHRPFVREGQTKLGFGRDFEWEGNEYNISLKTRGYRYQIPRPIPVEVLKGRIKGKRKNPIEEYLPKPVKATEGEDTEGGGEGEGGGGE